MEQLRLYTLRKTNIAPEKGWVGRRSPFLFRGRVSFQGCISLQVWRSVDHSSGTLKYWYEFSWWNMSFLGTLKYWWALGCWGFPWWVSLIYVWLIGFCIELAGNTIRMFSPEQISNISWKSVFYHGVACMNVGNLEGKSNPTRWQCRLVSSKSWCRRLQTFILNCQRWRINLMKKSRTWSLEKFDDKVVRTWRMRFSWIGAAETQAEW